VLARGVPARPAGHAGAHGRRAHAAARARRRARDARLGAPSVCLHGAGLPVPLVLAPARLALMGPAGDGRDVVLVLPGREHERRLRLAGEDVGTAALVLELVDEPL